MKINFKTFGLLISAFLLITAESFAASPGAMPKTGVYKSKCGELTVLQVTKKESKFLFKLETTDCSMNSGSIEKATALQICSDECSWVFQYDEFPDCRFWLNVKGDSIELSGNEDAASCGFGNRVLGNGKYKRAK